MKILLTEDEKKKIDNMYETLSKCINTYYNKYISVEKNKVIVKEKFDGM